MTQELKKKLLNVVALSGLVAKFFSTKQLQQFTRKKINLRQTTKNCQMQ